MLFPKNELFPITDTSSVSVFSIRITAGFRLDGLRKYNINS